MKKNPILPSCQFPYDIFPIFNGTSPAPIAKQGDVNDI